MAPVHHLGFEELGIRHDDRDSIEGHHFGAAQADLLNRALKLADLDEITHLDRPLEDDDQATDEVLGDALQPEAQGHTEHAGEQGQGAQVEPPELKQHQRADEQQGVLHHEGDPFLGTFTDPRVLQHAGAQQPLQHPQPLGQGQEQGDQHDHIQHRVAAFPQRQEGGGEAVGERVTQPLQGHPAERKQVGHCAGHADPDRHLKAAQQGPDQEAAARLPWDQLTIGARMGPRLREGPPEDGPQQALQQESPQQQGERAQPHPLDVGGLPLQASLLQGLHEAAAPGFRLVLRAQALRRVQAGHRQQGLAIEADHRQPIALHHLEHSRPGVPGGSLEQVIGRIRPLLGAVVLRAPHLEQAGPVHFHLGGRDLFRGPAG